MPGAVGSLRWDLVANAGGLISGLRKADRAVNRTADNMKKKGRAAQGRFGPEKATAGGVGGLIGSASSAFARLAPVVGGVTAAMAAYKKGLDRLTQITDEQTKRVEDLVSALRAAGRHGRTARQQQAFLAAQEDILARGQQFQERRMAASGNLISSEQFGAMVRMSDTNQVLAQSLDSLKAEIARTFEPFLRVFRLTMIGFTNNIKRLLEAVNRLRQFQFRFLEALGDLLPGGMGQALRERIQAIRLERQNQKNRAQELRVSDIQGSLPAQTSARQGSVQEYQFFVRRQRQQDNIQIELAKERNLLLREFIAELRGSQRNPATGEPQAVFGVE